jgi:phage anti-repressor protein
MGYIYCATSDILKDDHYKIGMTLCKEEASLVSYLTKRYGTPYGCCVKLVTYKQVGNPRVAEKYIHSYLKTHCKGGEIFNCSIDIIQQGMDTIPETEQIAPKQKRDKFLDTVQKHTSVPQEFIKDFFPTYNAITPIHTEFAIKLEAVVKWLDVNKRSLVSTLKCSYKQNIDFTVEKKIDVIKRDNRHNNYKQYLLSFNCFKRLVMLSHSKNADTIRTYLIEIESIIPNLI